MELILKWSGEPDEVAKEFAEFARLMGPLVAPAIADINRLKKDRDG